MESEDKLVKTIETKEFLLQFDKEIKRIASIHSSDRALHILLSKYEKKLPDEIEDIDYFHKMFRQKDVTDANGMDMVIWHLIGSSQEFFDVFRTMQELK